MDRASRRVPLEKRKRTETSCDRCKARKQKCDRLLDQPQCRYCEIHGLVCITTAPRKKRVHGLEGVGSRMTLLESLVKGLLPEADLSSIDDMQEIGKSLGIPLPPVEDSTAGDAHAIKNTRDDEEVAIEVIPDQQNQTQYVGPSSSFLFHLKLRRMLGTYSEFKFALFGSNAADQVLEPSKSPESSRNINLTEPRVTGGVFNDCASPHEAVRKVDAAALETLMDAYFDLIHPDFPVLHEPSFREAYESWSASNSTADPARLCSVLCVVILARRVAPIEIPEEAEKKWWTHVQTLLPTVIFSSNMSTIQALMLAALHLHNTNHRDACWNLTGTAVRVAHAIGMHRNDIKHKESRLNRELRKQLWWTLYAFEQMQVSSYDRPSAIAHVASSVESANERIVGTAGPFPPEFTKWSRKLLVVLGTACTALQPAGTGGAPAPEDAYRKPLSPTAIILRDLARWKQCLPSHLRLLVLDSLAPSSQRPLILLHTQYYYILVLVTRSALLRRATILTQKAPNESVPPALVTASETCVSAGQSLAQQLRKLDVIHKFNAVTWFDTFYLVAAALILVLDIRVKVNVSASASESQQLLQDLARLAARHMHNQRMPGTMRALAQIVVDVSSTAKQFSTASVETSHDVQPQPELGLPSIRRPNPSRALEDSHLHLAPHGNELDMLQNQTYDSEFWAQLSFMDEADGTFQDWAWNDIETVVRGK